MAHSLSVCGCQSGCPKQFVLPVHCAPRLQITAVRGIQVYVVLLHDRTRQEPWGLYVGQTSRESRFKVRSAQVRLQSERPCSALWRVSAVGAHPASEPFAAMGVSRSRSGAGRRFASSRHSLGRRRTLKRTSAMPEEQTIHSLGGHAPAAVVAVHGPDIAYSRDYVSEFHGR